MIRRLWLSTALALVIGLSAGLLALESAQACGGFFCQGSPVDQNAERIIFTQNGDGTISAYVQIQYTGSADAFSWILPLPAPIGVDDVEVPEDSMTAFTELEVLTDPVFIAPPRPECMPQVFRALASAAADGSVTQYASGEVGPYGFDVIGSEDPNALITWLRDNGYRVTADMEPLIEVYVDEGMPFLAMQLLPEQGAQDVQPVKITYPSDLPMIPLRLTAVAANPNMAVMVWFYADSQATPTNYARMEIADEDIVFTAFGGGSNYRQLIGSTANRFGGHAFVTEYAAPTLELSPRHPLLQELKADYAYLTRLNTVISPEEMTVDPVFDYDPQLEDVSNVHDLSSWVPKYDCDDAPRGMNMSFTASPAGPIRVASDSVGDFVADVGTTLANALTPEPENISPSPAQSADDADPVPLWAALLATIGAGAVASGALYGGYKLAMRRSKPYWGQ